MDGFSKKVFDTFPYVAKFDDEVELVPNFKPKKIESLCILCPAAPSEETNKLQYPAFKQNCTNIFESSEYW